MNQKIRKILIYLLFILLGLAFYSHFFKFPIISLVTLGGIIFIAYKIKIPKFALVLFIVAFILRLIVVFIFKTPIQSDYAVMYNMANDMLDGNWNVITESEYMNRYGYQMGYTMFMYILMLIVKGPLLIKIVNCLFSAGIVLFVYLLAKEFTSEKAARIVSCCYMFFPFPLLFNTVLSNQHISSFMFLLAIWLLISKKANKINEKLKFTLIGVCLAIGNIIRPEAIVIITSIILFTLLIYKKVMLKRSLVNLGIMAIVYFSITTIVSLGFQYSGLSPNGLKNTETLYKFAVGFNQERMGDYNKNLGKEFFNLTESEKKNLVYNYTIGSIDKLPRLFIHKLQHFWATSDVGWSLSYLNDKSIHILGKQISANALIKLVDEINQLFIYVFIFLSILAIWINRKNMSNQQFLLLMVLLVYTGVYLLIECTPRYAYTAQIFMFIMSAYSVDYIIKRKIENKHVLQIKGVKKIKSDENFNKKKFSNRKNRSKDKINVK